MDRHATGELTMALDPPTDLPEDPGEALANARQRLRTSLLDGAISAPARPVDSEYFEALRKRVRGE